MLTCDSLLAQDKRGQQLFEEGRYSAVLDHYTRNYKNGLSSPDIRLMCSSMLRLGLVEDALEMTQRVYMNKPDDPDIVLAMSEALLYNKQYATAYYLLAELSEDMEFEEEDLIDVTSRAAILAEWESRQTNYKVTRLEGFNTEKNEFSLLIHEGRYIFCSSQTKEDPQAEKYDKNRKDYSSLFEASGETDEHLPFNNGSLKGRFNIGPFAFGPDGFYFTFSAKIGPGMNQLMIMRTDSEDPNMADAEKVTLIEGEYNFAHPSFSPEGDRMVFSSDMPGGYGGMDIWYSVMTPQGWSAPMNMGEIVNTEGNEVFPRLMDGELFFSSNGHPGYGGLDIFVVTDDRHREDLRNLYAPINSPFDDFGYIRIDNGSGYFTSNRPGGEGGDDIYKYEEVKIEPDQRLITGIFEMKGLPQKNVKLVLVDTEGNILEQTFTDADGVFRFNRDPSGGTYNIRLAKEEAVKEAVIFLTDSKGEKSKRLVADPFGNFTLEMLALDDYFIDYMDVKDNSLFAFNLRGQVFLNEPGDMDASTEVSMLNSNGIVQNEAKSEKEGYFQLNQVVPMDRYVFHVESGGQPVMMAILDDNDMIVNILRADETGRFYYERPYEEGEFIALYAENDELIMVEKDISIELSDILYDLNSWELNPNSRKEIDKLISLLKNNEGLRIALSSHTDCRGDRAYNEELSEKRAKEVLAYIVSNGVDPTRIEAKGLGEAEPVNSCFDGVSCTEDEHALNRRTEFRILSN